VEVSPLPVCATDVTKEMLEIRPAEALAVNFTLQLHCVPDESVDISNPRDGLLRMVKGLFPKVITIVEHELGTNTTPFFMRFGETMDCYLAMFGKCISYNKETAESMVRSRLFFSWMQFCSASSAPFIQAKEWCVLAC
jgi:hypothetical protein